MQGRKKKRPLNKSSVAKNREPVVEIGNDEDHEEANMFMTQSTPPLKKQKKTREIPITGGPTCINRLKQKKEKAQSPQPEEAVTTSKKSKKHKHKKAKARKGPQRP